MNDPNDLARAEQFLELGRYAEAETLLRALLADHPGSVEVLHALATVLLFAERNEESLELARQALTLNPEAPTCRIGGCATPNQPIGNAYGTGSASHSVKESGGQVTHKHKPNKK